MIELFASPPRPLRLRIEVFGEKIPFLDMLGEKWEEIEPVFSPGSLNPAVLQNLAMICEERGADISLNFSLEEIDSLRGLRSLKVSRLLLSISPKLSPEEIFNLLSRWRQAFDSREIGLRVSSRSRDLKDLPGVLEAGVRAGISRVVLEPVLPEGGVRDQVVRQLNEFQISEAGRSWPKSITRPVSSRSVLARLLSSRLGVESLVKDQRLSLESEPIRECLFPWDWMFVSADGEVTPCPLSGDIMGKIPELAPDEIWQGEKYRDFRRRLLSPSPPGCCRRCCLRPFTAPFKRGFWAWNGIHDRFGVVLGPGWYQDEGAGFRWSREKGTIILQGQGESRLGLVLTRMLGGPGRSGQVMVNGEKIGTWGLRWPGDHKLVYDIPPVRGIAVIGLIPDQVECPQSSSQGWVDRRHLGVAWKGATLLG